jgi:hypothetical protein
VSRGVISCVALRHLPFNRTSHSFSQPHKRPLAPSPPNPRGEYDVMSNTIPRLALCLAVLSTSTSSYAVCDTILDLYAGPLTSKIRPDSAPVHFPKNQTVHLDAAKREFVAFEVFVNNNGCHTIGPITGIDVPTPSFAGPGGYTITGNNVTIFREAYLKTTTPSTSDVTTGYWPDILIPKIDDTQYHESRCGFYTLSGGSPTDTLQTHLDTSYSNSCNSTCSYSCANDFLAANEFRAFVVQIFVPPDAPAGLYTGTVHVTYSDPSFPSYRNDASYPVPVSLLVRGFTLPPLSNLKTNFGLGGMMTIAQVEGVAWDATNNTWGSPTDATTVAYWAFLYARYLLDHRIAADFLFNMTTPIGGAQPWSTFLAQYQGFLNGQDPNLTLLGASPSTIKYSGTWKPRLYEPGRGGDAQDQQEHSQWKANVPQAWYAKTFDNICDEPHHDDVYGATDWACGYRNHPITINGQPSLSSWAILKNNAANAHALTPDFQTFASTSGFEVTHQDSSYLTDVTMLGPTVNWFWDKVAEPAPVNATYQHYTRSDYTAYAYPASGVWWYQTCSSMASCVNGNIGSAAQAQYYPNYAVDTSLPALNRVMEWLTYRYDIHGEFYYDTTANLVNSWSSVYLAGNNGDGTLLYPGLVSRIGGTHDIPLPSLRLLMIRAGLQDYEYLYELGTVLGDSADANAAVDALFGGIASPPNPAPPYADANAPLYLTPQNIDAQRTFLANAIEARLGTGTQATFNVSVSPRYQSVTIGHNGTWTVTVTPTIGAPSQTITLGADSLPSFGSLNPNWTGTVCYNQPTCQFQLGTQPVASQISLGAASQGVGSFLVYADNGSSRVQQSLGFQAWPPGGGIAVSAGPTAASVPAGQSTQLNVTVTPGGGFTSDTALSVAGLPAGASYSFPNGNVVSGGSGTAAVMVNAGTATAGSYNFTVTGTGGSYSTSTTVPLSVSYTTSATSTQQVRTNFHEDAHGVAFDAAGNYYVAGNSSGNLPGKTSQGMNDWIVMKYSGAGALLWQTQLGDIGDDIVTGVATDGSSYEYAVGYTNRSVKWSFTGGRADGMIAKLDSAGNVLWTQLIGTAGDDYIQAVAVDANHNVYVAGATTGSLGGPNQGGSDAWVAKYDPSFNRVWVAQLGGAGDQIAYGVAVDSSGNVFIAGSTTTAITGSATYLGGAHDAFFAKYSSAGSLMWASEVGTSSDDSAYAIALDSAGNPIVAGSTTGGYGYQPQGGIDAWVGKYTAAYGSYLWARLLGSPTDEWVTGVAVDASGNVYITGPNNGPLYSNYQGGYDVFLAKYNSSGARLWIKNYGGPTDDVANAVAVYSSTIAVVGSTTGSLGRDSSAGKDVFLASFAP